MVSTVLVLVGLLNKSAEYNDLALSVSRHASRIPKRMSNVRLNLIFVRLVDI